MTELNRAAWRRRDPELRLVDTRLQMWAPWAKPSFSALGYPTRSVTERAREGGIRAKALGGPPPQEWPEPVLEADRAVARLPTRQQAALFANYFHADDPAETRSAIYLRTARRLAASRPGALQGVRPSEPAGPRAFREDLDRARWTLKAMLGA